MYLFPIITCYIITGEGECSVCPWDVHQCDGPQWPGQQHRSGGGDDAGLCGERWQPIGQKSRYTSQQSSSDKFCGLIHTYSYTRAVKLQKDVSPLVQQLESLVCNEVVTFLFQEVVVPLSSLVQQFESMFTNLWSVPRSLTYNISITGSSRSAFFPGSAVWVAVH